MRIMIFAYLDNNIGDDLMLYLLSKRFSNDEFYLYSANSAVVATFNQFKNFLIKPPSERNKDLEHVDMILSIGGSIFNDLNSFRGKISRLRKLYFLLKAKKSGKLIATIGCNLGPYKDRFGIDLTVFELKLNNLITVRDNASYDLLLERSVSNAYLASDIVYGIKNEFLTDSNLTRTGLGVSAFRSTHSGELNYENYQALALVIDSYIERTGLSVKIFAFDSECENDLSAAHHILRLVKHKNKTEIVPYLGDIASFIEEFNSCSVHISIRFHSAVLSDALRMRFYPISYSNKMEALIGDKYSDFDVLSIQCLTPNDPRLSVLTDSVCSGIGLCNGGSESGDSVLHFDMLSKLIREKSNV